MEQVPTVSVAENTTKLLSVGRVWVNDRQNDAQTSPKMTLRLDRNLGINILLGAGNEMLFFANEKRTGNNPATGNPYQDPDYRATIALPAAIVDKEIERQKAEAQVAQASAEELHAQPEAQQVH